MKKEKMWKNCYRGLWTGTGKTDKIAMREVILSAIRKHKIEIDSITNRRTLEYLMGFKRYSTERAVKAITYELTENDEWSIKGKLLGECWYHDCCVMENPDKRKCNLDTIMSGETKVERLLADRETQRILLACR